MLRSGWPEFPCICLDCRTALESGEQCDGGSGHREVDLRGARGAELIRLEVWGHPLERKRARQRAGTWVGWLRDAALGLAVVALVGSLESLFLLVVTGVISAGFLVALLGARAVRWLRAGAPPRRLLPPAGARWPPPAPARGAEIVVGTVITPAAHARLPPTGGEPALAYALWTWADGAVSLAEAATLGFELVTDDGQRVRVPAGRCRFAPAPAVPAGVCPERLRAYANARDKRRDAEFPGIPVDRCALELLQPDQRLRVAAAFAREPLADPAHAGDYRTAPAVVWVARGVAVLTVEEEP